MATKAPEVRLARACGKIEKLVAADVGVTAGMTELVAWCARQHPHRDWKRLAAIRWEDDLCRLAVWLERTLRHAAPPKTITGLWFGLFNPVEDDDRTTADVYVCGNPYHPDPEREWAVGPRWTGPDARSRALAEIYAIAYAPGTSPLENEAEYALCLGYAALAVRALSRALDPAVLRGKATARTFEVGFDSGDSIVVARL